MKKSNNHHKEIDRVGIDFKQMLEEIKAERYRRKIDKNMKSHKRICTGLYNLYKSNPNFKKILLSAEMPDIKKTEL